MLNLVKLMITRRRKLKNYTASMFNPFFTPDQTDKMLEEEKQQREQQTLIAAEIKALTNLPGWKHIQNWMDQQIENTRWTARDYLKADQPNLQLIYHRAVEDVVIEFDDWIKAQLTIINDEHYEQENDSKK